ncbi:hypothetical protein ACWDZX_07235 [Streptomyces collinus]
MGSRPVGLRAPDDDDRADGAGRDREADGSQQHPSDLAAPA